MELLSDSNNIEHSVWGDYINRSFFSYHRKNAEVEIRQFDLEPGDRVFLCTDGVSSYVNPDILRDRLMDDKSSEDIVDIVKFLCEKSNSPDNYSGILVCNIWAIQGKRTTPIRRIFLIR